MAEPEVVFRIVHVAATDCQPPAAYREQAVQVALGPNPTLPAYHVGTLKRRVPSDRVVTGARPLRGKPKPPREPKTPGAVAMLRKAIAWRALLDAGQAANQADIARREGVTRARVTQVMGLLRLVPEIHEHIFSLPKTIQRPALTELALRPVARLMGRDAQIAAFRKLIGETDDWAHKLV